MWRRRFVAMRYQTPLMFGEDPIGILQCYVILYS
jgi:hypothetical protein